MFAYQHETQNRNLRQVHWLVRIVCVVLLTLFVLGLIGVGFAYVRLANGPVEHPKLLSYVENRINNEMPQSNVKIGYFQVIGGDKVTSPQVLLKDLSLRNKDGERLMVLPHAELTFSGMSALRGAARPQELKISDMRLTIIREENGHFNFLTQGDERDFEFHSIARALDEFDRIAWLSDLKTVSFDDTQIFFDDQVSGKLYQFNKATVVLNRDTEAFDLFADLSLRQRGLPDAQLQLSMRHIIGDAKSQIKVGFKDVPPSVLAEQVQTLQWLRLVDTQATGSFLLDINEDDVLGDFSATLNLAQGTIGDHNTTSHIPFENVSTYFHYKSENDELVFDSFDVTSELIKFSAAGRAKLKRDVFNDISGMKTSLAFTHFDLGKIDSLDAPLSFNEGRFEGDITLDAFRLDAKDIILKDGDNTYHATGSSWSTLDGWQSNYNIRVNQIDTARLKALWPLQLGAKTRTWIDQNISAGTVHDFHGNILIRDAKATFDFQFLAQDVTARVMKTMPVLREATGIGRLTEKSFRIKLEKGHIISTNEAKVDLAGSEFYIPAIREKPAKATVSLNTRSTLPGILSLLDVEKFQFMKKIGLSPNVASGRVASTGVLRFPLIKKAKPRDVYLSFNGTLTDMKTDRLVKGKPIRASKLVFKVTNKGLNLTGPVSFDGIQTDANWDMPFGRNTNRVNRISAKVPLSQSSLNKFNVRLPKGTISGTAGGKLDVVLRRGNDPSFTLTSNLLGAQMSVPTLNWFKNKKTKGALTIKGRFGKQAKIDSLDVNAAGLRAKGAVSLKSSGGLDVASFSTFKMGNWLDATAKIIGRDKRDAKIVLKGGKADLRRFNLKTGGKGGSPVDMTLSRLIITDSITLHNMNSSLTTRGGAVGKFSGSVNKAAKINGTLKPTKNGAKIEIASKNAGAVLRAANLLDTYRGGTLHMTMTPQRKSGVYSGSFSINGGRLKQTNGMADLLNAMSVVGLLQQLESSGIHFEKTRGSFIMRPSGVELRNVSAVGPSMGITANGWYDAKRKTIDIEGVVTPLYLINGAFERVFGKLFGRQRGEGAFSFTYTMKGSTAKPRVRVNPLSILTPGVFREIFRQKIPTPSQ